MEGKSVRLRYKYAVGTIILLIVAGMLLLGIYKGFIATNSSYRSDYQTEYEK